MPAVVVFSPSPPCAWSPSRHLEADAVVLTGVEEGDMLDESTYRRLAADLRATGRTVVADLSGPALPAAVDGGLHVLEVAHDELAETEVCEGTGVEQLVAGARRLQERGAQTVLVSRAGDPAILLLPDGSAHEVSGPDLTVVQHRGAGDSTCGALAAAAASGTDPVQAARLASAAGALDVTRRGLGTGYADAVHALAARTQVRPLR